MLPANPTDDLGDNQMPRPGDPIDWSALTRDHPLPDRSTDDKAGRTARPLGDHNLDDLRLPGQRAEPNRGRRLTLVDVAVILALIVIVVVASSKTVGMSGSQTFRPVRNINDAPR